mgnify:CR=1 FL=1|tara:strand:+ start:6050 stop:6301 length:252 start_codon:yes stop_codon:yes gene_type:complete
MTEPGDLIAVTIDLPSGIYTGPAVVTFVNVDHAGVELAHLARPDGRTLCNGYKTGRVDTSHAPRPDPRFETTTEPPTDGAANE